MTTTSSKKRIVVVLTVDDLRLTEVQISRALSWERPAQDVLWELVHNPAVNTLLQCAAVVVTFDTTAALLLEGRTGRARLYFDPALIEGEWAPAYPGGVIGYTSCLTAGIARRLMLEPGEPDLDPGIRAGLAAMRRLHRDGYGDRVGAPAGPRQQPHGEDSTGIEGPALAFPIDAIVEELARDDAPSRSSRFGTRSTTKGSQGEPAPALGLRFRSSAGGSAAGIPVPAPSATGGGGDTAPAPTFALHASPQTFTIG